MGAYDYRPTLSLVVNGASNETPLRVRPTAQDIVNVALTLDRCTTSYYGGCYFDPWADERHQRHCAEWLERNLARHRAPPWWQAFPLRRHHANRTPVATFGRCARPTQRKQPGHRYGGMKGARLRARR